MNTASLTPFNGSDYSHDRDAPRLTEQLQRVFNVLSDEQWHTLEGIARITGDPTPSISAQIRHLRKARFGGHEIEKTYYGDGLYAYRLTGEKTTPSSKPAEDSAPLPPSAPELLEIAHKKLGQIQTELELVRAKCDTLTTALESIIRAVPARVFSGELYYESFDSRGNWIGNKMTNAVPVIRDVMKHAQDGLSAAARLDPQIFTQTP